jgi:hypothetical protein
MEVHHPHHTSHQKKWNEYILEFLMLFLAVSLGFFAENLREHYVEKERAHELVESFMKDVKTNIGYLDSLINNDRKMIFKNDSSISYLLNNDKINLDSFYNYLPLVSYRYLNNNETYDQMKSSGSLRYIKDTTLLRKVINYNNASKAAEFRSVTQEYDYTAHEYIDALQKWMPGEIAVKRHTKPYLTNPSFVRMMVGNENRELISNLFNSGKGKSFTLTGSDLDQMRKELIPVISRKTYLMSASELYMYTTLDQAKDLILYYKERNKETD